MDNDKQRMPRYWLMKSEPEVFSIDALAAHGETVWDSVRNYQARNFMMHEMQVGDQVLFYHSGCEVPGVAGIAQVSSGAEPDPTQFDKKSEYFDAKATKAKPIWHCVRVKFKERFPRLVTLAEMRAQPQLENLALLRKGQRLSIQPVSKEEFRFITRMAQARDAHT